MNRFSAFSAEHWASLFAILIASVTVPLIFAGRRASSRRFEVTLASFILTFKFVEPFYLIYSGKHWQDALPLQLCDLGAILTAALLLSRNYLSYELTYFWGFGGTLQALLTPNLKQGFPSTEYWLFFVSHGLVILGALYGTIVFKLRPTLKSLFRVFSITLAVAGVIGAVNWLLDANYMFLCKKPSAASLLDYLGPWPYYILSLVPVSLMLFMIYYSPFFLFDLIGRRAVKNHSQMF